MSSHINTEVKTQVRSKKDMTPNEAIIYSLITNQMNFNLTYFKIRDEVLSMIEQKQARSRKKKDLDSIYERFIKGSIADEKTKEINSFLNVLGID